jgi:hypothetical protein
MKIINDIIKTVISHHASDSNKSCCNYSNNYYGDQICVVAKPLSR